MGSEGNLQDSIIKNGSVAADGEEVFGGFDAVERYSFFIAIADASIPVVVLKILDDELLTNVDDLVEFFGD